MVVLIVAPPGEVKISVVPLKVTLKVLFKGLRLTVVETVVFSGNNSRIVPLKVAAIV